MRLAQQITLAVFAAASIVSLSAVAEAQTLYDKVIVDLPYAVTINNTTLDPGHYVIRQLDTVGGGSRVLQIFSDNGMKLETSAITIPTLDNATPEKTDVILHHYGKDYFFDKIWIQGKNYGYEFPLPPSIKSRENERMEPYTVAAKYEGAQQENTQVAEAAPTPAPAAEPAPVPEPQTSVPAPTASAPTPAPAPETNTMPTTADGWPMEVAAGLVLALMGLMLRRRTA